MCPHHQIIINTKLKYLLGDIALRVNKFTMKKRSVS